MNSGMLPNASPCAFVIVSLKVQSQPCKAAVKIKAVEMSVCPALCMWWLESRWMDYYEFIKFYEYLSKYTNFYLDWTVLSTALQEELLDLYVLQFGKNS